ncbi:30S ribosomal protein S16, partial [bacterium]|nr:30S ribosomal protein S16 [bacterium]
MLAIKFARRGKKHQPIFRLIVLEKTKDPFGDFLENLGYYNPRTKEAKLKKERILYWISKGAQPTDSVHNFLINQGIIKGQKRNVVKKHREEKEEKKEEREEEKKEEIKEEKKEEVQKTETTEENK